MLAALIWKMPRFAWYQEFLLCPKHCRLIISMTSNAIWCWYSLFLFVETELQSAKKLTGAAPIDVLSTSASASASASVSAATRIGHKNENNFWLSCLFSDWRIPSVPGKGNSTLMNFAHFWITFKRLLFAVFLSQIFHSWGWSPSYV